MKRSEMIDQMINFSKTIPEHVSEYHRFDTLLSLMERLGILPPERFNSPEGGFEHAWDRED
jgi:hypothetical protein